ncbi:MAG: hypothetical protein H7Y22_13265 [Gemmatimonadaceae bacterium]|nr:hypothetical protein [Gloeobacterales cyanobacterium ES-bin-141]
MTHSNIRVPEVLTHEDWPLSAAQSLWENVRQVHALEHATIWVLSEQTQIHLGGASTDRGFFVYGQVDSGDLLRAAHQALRRINQGEERLAVHPRCGTNLSVGMLLTAAMSLGVGLFLPRRPLPQLLGAVAAAFTAAQIAGELGAMAQRHLTTSIPRNLEIVGVKTLTDWLGRRSHFVEVSYISR